MKTIIPILLCLILLSTSACKKMYPVADVKPDGKFAKATSGVPPTTLFNGFVVGGELYEAYYIGQSVALHQQFWFQSDVNEGATFSINIKDPLPISDGIYSYVLDRDISQPNNMHVTCNLNSLKQIFEIYSPTGQVAILKVSGGTVSLSIPEVQLESMDGPVNFITVSATLLIPRPFSPVQSTEPVIVTD